MKQFIKLTLALFSCSLITTHALAENLIELYDLAKDNDQIIQAAAQTYQAEAEAMPQARAALLPTIAVTSGATAFNSNDPSKKGNSWTGYGLSINQPIFQINVWSKLSQAKDTVKKAFANLADAKQTLLLRVSKQYFNVLKTQDNLNFAKAAQKAFAKQLEQASQRYKVGLIAITDVLNAQAAHDNSYAQVIAAENELANARELLRVIVGKNIINLAPLKPIINFTPPIPANTKKWVQLAYEKNWALQAARYDLAIAKKQIQENRAANYPTVALTSNVHRGKNYSASPTSLNKSTDRNVGIVLNMPLFSGGSVISKTRQASYRYEAAKDTYQGKSRTTESDTRQAYNGVVTQLSQIKALKQAVISNKSALKATQAAYDAGTRTIVDVLNAQSSLINAEKNYAAARYTYIAQSLQLKQATGILSVSDLQEINTWLQ